VNPRLHVSGIPADGAMSEYDLVRDVPSHPGGTHSAVEQLRRYLGGGKEPTPVCGRLNALLRAPSVGTEHLQGAIRSCHLLKPLLEDRKATAVKQGGLNRLISVVVYKRAGPTLNQNRPPVHTPCSKELIEAGSRLSKVLPLPKAVGLSGREASTTLF